ncbi:hypothetical protein J4E89_009713 [Alternaria sp. Ai002NY15]|nr:hypothetical protein J4E89_009713 [Alternaria sp. Ai002NY15]
MRKSDLPNAFIIEVNGRFIAECPELDREETDGNVKSATPAHMGELKNATVFKLVGGRLVSGEWIMAVVEGGYGDDYSPKGLWWIDGHDEYVRDVANIVATVLELTLLAGVMKMHWQKV